MDFSRLTEAELYEFLQYNGVTNVGTDKATLVFYANAVVNSKNPNIIITVPILALYKAHVYYEYLTGHETTQADFFAPNKVSSLKELAEKLQLTPYTETTRLIIFRILQIQGRVIEQSYDELYLQDYFEKVLALVRKNDVASITDLLNRGMSANMCSPKDHRCILWYASIDNGVSAYPSQMIRLLLERGASLNVQGADESILENVGYATEAEVDRMVLFRDLIEIYKASMEEVQNKKENILFTTVKAPNKITTAYLLSKGLNPNGYVDEDNPSLNLILEKPILAGDISMIELLLRYGADVNQVNAKGKSAKDRLLKFIKRATKNGDVEKIVLYNTILSLFKYNELRSLK